MKVWAMPLLEMTQPETEDQTPWWPMPAPTGQSSRTTIAGSDACKGGLNMNLSAEFHAENKR